MKTLSSKQQQILAFLRRFREEKDYPPTVRDILRACGISSTSVVDYNLRILEREGYIRRDREVSRGIEMLDKTQRRIIRVPLLGYISAGEPIPVPASDTWETEPLDTVEGSGELIRGKENVYALKVKGTSMIDALINDGDIVLMQQANTAEDGEMVAAWLKEEEHRYGMGNGKPYGSAFSARQPLFVFAGRPRLFSGAYPQARGAAQDTGASSALCRRSIYYQGRAPFLGRP